MSSRQYVSAFSKAFITYNSKYESDTNSGRHTNINSLKSPAKIMMIGVFLSKKLHPLAE